MRADGFADGDSYEHSHVHGDVYTVTDLAGGWSDTTTDVIVNTLPPTLTVSSPISGAQTNQGSIDVMGNTPEPSDVVTVNDVPASIDANGTFTATASLPNECITGLRCWQPASTHGATTRTGTSTT